MFGLPANACDCHMHIYDARFSPVDPKSSIPAGTTVQDYQDMQQRLGVERTVIVTPRLYGTDNRVTLDAIEQLGADKARGVAVLHPDVTDQTLQHLHDGGIRGVRFTLYTTQGAATSFEMIETLSSRVNELGWHVQLHLTADQVVEHQQMLMRLPSRIVFDHLARLPVAQGVSHPAFNIVRTLLDRGQTWLKLSGPYLDSEVGQNAEYSDTDEIAKTWIKTAIERLVWGSDWPHITERDNPPPTEMMVRVLQRWVDYDGDLHKILVTNPAELYQFGLS